MRREDLSPWFFDYTITDSRVRKYIFGISAELLARFLSLFPPLFIGLYAFWLSFSSARIFPTRLEHALQP